MKSVLEYKDYLDFLKDFLQKKKGENSGFSYTVWAQKMDLKSSSMLSMVITGERFPSKSLIEKLSQYIGFTSAEAEYFETLIDLKKLKSKSRLTVNIDGNNLSNISLSNESTFLSPMTFIVKELVSENKNKNINSEWLNKNLLVKHQNYDLQKILAELTEKEILHKNEEGNFSVLENNIVNIMTTPEQVQNFHNASLEMTKQAYNTSQRDQRTFHTSFVKLKKDKLELVKKRMQEFQRELTDLMEEGDGDHILYQVNFHLFPISQTIKAID